MIYLDAIDFLIDKNIISEIIEHYSKNLKENYKEINRKLIYRILSYESDIQKSKKYWPLFDIGIFYKEEVSYNKRKKLGEIYTPQKIVNIILNECGFLAEANLESKKLIDLSCGSGSFLINSINRVLNYYLKKFNKRKTSELFPYQAEKIISTIKENIYGIDVNPIACILTQINFHINLYDLYKKILEKENNYTLPKYNIFQINSLNLANNEFSSLPRRFDYVVGNPPYIFIRNIPDDHKKIIDSGKFQTDKGQYDYYQLFLELGIKFLRDEGKLGYIIPDSILALSNRRAIRKYIYETTKIRKIIGVGPQFENSIVSNIIIILQKELNRSKRERNLINVEFHNSGKQKTNKIQQKQIKKWNYRFLIDLNEKDIEILNYLNHNFPTLSDLIANNKFRVSLSRGVELTKDGKVFYCRVCKKYYPIPKNKKKCNICGSRIDKSSIEDIIIDQCPNSEDKSYYYPYIYSLQRYNISQYKFINIVKKGIKYKNLENYRDRVIIRQISEDGLICAAYDPDISLCSQSFYNLKIIDSKIPEFNNLYLLGLINSKLLSYFFIKSFGSYKQLFPRILIEKIKSLPIKIPEKPKEKLNALSIIKNVKSLLNQNKKQTNKKSNLQDDIDQFVYSLYQLETNQREYINRIIEGIKK